MNIEERLAEVERRLNLLENKTAIENSNPKSESKTTNLVNKEIIKIDVSNKRYEAGQYDNSIWFDCAYTLKATSKPTRAVKGVIVFSDLFGEAKFRIQVTINDPLQPGKSFSILGTGFNYNEFMAEHQWMLVTEIKDMQFIFVTLSVIYSDDTSENFL